MTREEYAWKTFEQGLTQLRSKATYEDINKHTVLNVLLAFVEDLGTQHSVEVIVEELRQDAVVNNECNHCSAVATRHYCNDCATIEAD